MQKIIENYTSRILISGKIVKPPIEYICLTFSYLYNKRTVLIYF